MHSETNLEIVFVVIMRFDLKSVTSFDLKLTVEECLALGIEGADVDRALAFKHGKKVLRVYEGHLAN